MSRNMTMQDIADRVGVSRTTVSLVLSGNGARYRIAEETRDRVLEAVHETGFRPNYFATALNRKQTGVIGLLFPDLFEEFMTQILRGIEDVLLDTDFMPLICTNRFDFEREQHQIDRLLHRGVDGLIVAPTAEFSGTERPTEIYDRLIEEGYPLVFLDRFPAGMDTGHAVLQDDRNGGGLAAAYLVSKGCRRPAYIGFDLDIGSLKDRLEGFASVLADRHVAFPQARKALLREINADSHDLAKVMDHWFEDKSPPDGIFVSTSGLALRCRELLAQRGLTAGRDIPLVRFGASDEQKAGTITGIRQPHYAMGFAAAEQLTELIKANEGIPFRRIVLPVELDTNDKEQA